MFFDNSVKGTNKEEVNMLDKSLIICVTLLMLNFSFAIGLANPITRLVNERLHSDRKIEDLGKICGFIYIGMLWIEVAIFAVVVAVKTE